MKLITKIEIIFENCESVSIPSIHFGDFLLDDIKELAERQAINAIMIHKRADFVAFELFNTANSVSTGNKTSNMTVLERIFSCDDITGFELHYSDGSSETIYVKWSADNNDTNSYQKSYISNVGHLYVVISQEDQSVFGYFDRNAINDRESIEKFRKIIC